MTEGRDSSTQEPPRYVAVEGPIGVGKTTLARRLAHTFGSELLLEDPEANPFLERFYRERGRNALQVQLHFLLQRSEQLRGVRHGDLLGSRWVSDFLLEKDRLFAEATLGPEELALYEQVHAHVAAEPLTPELVIYLQAPTRVLLERIERRGIDAERHIDEAYLERLNEAYTRFFHFYDAAPLLIVNAAEIDLVHDDAQYERLVEELRRMRSARSYFNPHPTLI